MQKKSLLVFMVCLMLGLSIMLTGCGGNETITVMGNAMSPTIENGSKVSVFKTKNVARNDIIIFGDNSSVKSIKRVIALAGDEIWLEEVGETGIYLIHIFSEGIDQTLDENYILEPMGINVYKKFLQMLSNTASTNKYIVPEDSVFVLGDNRNNSLDSFTYGAILTESIYGKVVEIK